MRLLSILMLVLLGVALWLALTVRKVLFILSGGCL